MEKTKKLTSIAILLSILIGFGAVYQVFALHTANVYGIGASELYFMKKTVHPNDTLVLRKWQWTDSDNINMTFQVRNVKGADIVRVQLHIYENNRVLFHFLKGDAGPDWNTRILEKDTHGWARLIEFFSAQAPNGTYIAPIGEPKTRSFTVTFGKNSSDVGIGPYDFSVTTIDSDGGSVEHTLYLGFDTLPPIIETQPTNGTIVHGIMVPCGADYFILNVTVYDDPKADTGISEVFIAIDDGQPYNYSNPSVGISPGEKWTLPPANSTIWGLANGTHTLNVTVLDGVGNKQTAIVHFTYIEPPGPRVSINPTSGHAAPKSWYNPTKHLLESEQKVYKNKVLGTNVTVTGENFEAGAKVTVTVTLPYGEYTVNTTTVKPDNTFETWFIFPKAPLGNYSINVYSKPCNLTLQNGRSAKFNVLPEIIYDPNEVIGPALINVEATGFINVSVPETGKVFILCNNKDTLQGVNFQAMFNWYIDGNGTLQNMITYATGRSTECGMYWPALEPGTYNITLFLATTGSYWNLNHWEPITNFEHTNTITVKDWTGDVIDAANAAETAAEGAETAAEDAKTAAEDAKTAAEDAAVNATAAANAAEEARDKAEEAKTAAEEARDAATAADDAKTAAEEAKGAAQGLTMPVYLAVIFSLIAAIIAAACAILVYRKIA